MISQPTVVNLVGEPEESLREKGASDRGQQKERDNNDDIDTSATSTGNTKAPNDDGDERAEPTAQAPPDQGDDGTMMEEEHRHRTYKETKALSDHHNNVRPQR